MNRVHTVVIHINGLFGGVSSCHRLDEPDKSVPCLEKEEKAIPLFNTDNLNASRVVVMVHRFEVMYRIQVSLVIRRSGYDKLWAELYRLIQETIPNFAFVKSLFKEGKLPSVLISV